MSCFSLSQPRLLHKNEMTRCITNISEDNCALLGYYAASSANSLPTFQDNLSCGMKNLNGFEVEQWYVRHNYFYWLIT